MILGPTTPWRRRTELDLNPVVVSPDAAQIGDFPMMRKQLLGIKRRAESRAPRADDRGEPTTTRTEARADLEISRTVTDLRLVELADLELAYTDVGASFRPAGDVRPASAPTFVHTI